MVPPPMDRDTRNDEGDEEGGQVSFFASLLQSLRNKIAHRRQLALIVSFVMIGLSILGFGLAATYIASIRNRPTLDDAVLALDYGSFIRARVDAESVLKYAKSSDSETRGGALYVIGVASCLLADISSDSDKVSLYLSAANYLQQSREEGFLRGRQEEGFFYLGKSLYLCGEMQQSRAPLLSALELGADDRKTIFWYLANAAFYAPEPDYEESLRYTTLFRKWPTTTQAEIYEGDLLETMILLQKGETELARHILATVPDKPELLAVQRLLAGRIAMDDARVLVRQANMLASLNDPSDAYRELLRKEGKLPPDTQKNKTNEQNKQNAAEIKNGVRFKDVETPETPLYVPDEPDPSEEPKNFDTPQPTPEPTIPPTTKVRDNPFARAVVSAYFDEPERFTDSGLIRRIAWMRQRETTEPRPAAANGSTPPLSPLLTPSLPPTDPTPTPTAAPTPPLPVPTPGAASPEPARDSETNSSEGVLPETPSTESPFTTSTGISEDEDAVRILDENFATPAPAPTPEAPALPLPEFPETATPEAAVEEEAERIREEIRSRRHAAVEKFEEAIRLCQEAIRQDDPPFRWSRQAMLLQGLCYESLAELRPGNDRQHAKNRYGTLIETYPESSEAIAAGFFLAESRQRLGRTEETLAAYRNAFRRLKEHPGYASSFLTQAMIFARTSDLFESYVDLEDFETAFALLESMGIMFPEEDILRLGSAALERWANTLKRQAGNALFATETGLQTQAEEKFRLAGKWFADYARYRFTHADYAEYLWKSAENYREGKDYRRSITMYLRYLQVEPERNHVEAYYLTGEMYFELDHLDEAIQSLRHCIDEFPKSAYIPWARILLAKAYREKGEWDEATRQLRINLNGAYGPKSTIYRDSLFALGNLYYEHGQVEQAIISLEDALFSHPRSAQAAQAHYRIAQSYLYRASESETAENEATLDRDKEYYRDAVRGDREKALEHYRQCEVLLRQRRDAVEPGAAEQLMMRNVMFGIGSQAMKLGRYEEAVEGFDRAVVQYQNTPDALHAMVQITMAHRALATQAEKQAESLEQRGETEAAAERRLEATRQISEAVARVNRAKILYENLKAAKAFVPGTRFTPSEWEDVLRFQERMARKP